MPRIRQNADRDTMRDFISEVNAQRWRSGLTSQRSFGEAVGISQSTAGKYLSAPESMPLGILRAVVKAVKPDPVVLLKALGYTAADIQRMRGGT